MLPTLLTPAVAQGYAHHPGTIDSSVGVYCQPSDSLSIKEIWHCSP